MRVPLGLRGIARNWITPSRASISNSRGAQPLASLASASSTGPLVGASSAVVTPSGWPTRSVARPMRWYADRALGEAYCTMPSPSRRISPSPTRGEASMSTCWFGNGKEPAAIICARSDALCR